MTPSLKHAIKKHMIKELKRADFQTVAQIARDLARPRMRAVDLTGINYN